MNNTLKLFGFLSLTAFALTFGAGCAANANEEGDTSTTTTTTADGTTASVANPPAAATDESDPSRPGYTNEDDGKSLSVDDGETKIQRRGDGLCCFFRVACCIPDNIR